MSLPQQKFREMVFQLLYSKDIGHANSDAMIELMMNELSLSKRNARLAYERVEQILQKTNEIDSLIGSVSTSYDFSRIQTVTKNILRLGVFELLFDDSIPPKVAIAESMRLARKFGTPESASFVNALLDQLYQTSLGAPVNKNLLEERAQDFIQSEELAQKLGLESEQTRHAEEE